VDSISELVDKTGLASMFDINNRMMRGT